MTMRIDDPLMGAEIPQVFFYGCHVVPPVAMAQRLEPLISALLRQTHAAFAAPIIHELHCNCY